MTGTPSAPVHQIGEVAEAVGLSLRTIRYYEEVGLAPPSGRTAGGFRLYTDDDIDRLRLVKHLKPLDLSLDEMRQLLDALAGVATDGEGRAAHLERIAMFAALVDERVGQLRAQLDAAGYVADELRRRAGRG